MQKKLLSRACIQEFWESESGKSFYSFIESLNASVKGLSNQDIESRRPFKPIILLIEQVLDNTTAWLNTEEFVILERRTRFGHPLFREWLQKVRLTFHELIFIPIHSLLQDEQLIILCQRLAISDGILSILSHSSSLLLIRILRVWRNKSVSFFAQY